MDKINYNLDYHFSKRPFIKNEPCGDLGYIKESKDHLFFALADVAGHGKNAYKLAVIIKKYLVKFYKSDLVDLMNDLHVLLRGSRGVVCLVGHLNKKTKVVKYIGLGNISMRKVGKKNVRTISNEGIIGYIIPTPKIKRLQLAVNDVLLLYTDGISDHFRTSECPEGLFNKDSKHIVNSIMKYFYKGNDDAACIAIRYKND